MGSLYNIFNPFYAIMPPFPAKNIAILSGLEIIGDGLIKLAFLRAIRHAWPEAKIHWITTKGPTVYNGPLRQTTSKLINEVHEQPSWLTPSSTEKPPTFDILFDTRGRWKLAWQIKQHIPHKLFIAPAFGYIFSDKRPTLLSKRPKRMIDRLLQMVELASGTTPETTGTLPIPASILEKAKKLLPNGQTYIGLSVGAGHGIKKWPLNSFKAVAAEQLKQGHIPVFILGPNEAKLFPTLSKEFPDALFPLQAYDQWETKKLSIEHTLAIGTCLNVAITNDSGTSHMLAAVDCPLISLFGPTSAEKLAPRVSKSRVIKAQAYDSNEMTAIPIDSVLKTIENVIFEK